MYCKIQEKRPGPKLGSLTSAMGDAALDTMSDHHPGSAGPALRMIQIILPLDRLRSIYISSLPSRQILLEYAKPAGPGRPGTVPWH